jgi:hypothetical protein
VWLSGPPLCGVGGEARCVCEGNKYTAVFVLCMRKVLDDAVTAVEYSNPHKITAWYERTARALSFRPPSHLVSSKSMRLTSSSPQA